MVSGLLNRALDLVVMAMSCTLRKRTYSLVCPKKSGSVDEEPNVNINGSMALGWMMLIVRRRKNGEDELQLVVTAEMVQLEEVATISLMIYLKIPM